MENNFKNGNNSITLERIPVMFVNKRSQRGSENSCILRD
jgi:hypothetical protein